MGKGRKRRKGKLGVGGRRRWMGLWRKEDARFGGDVVVDVVVVNRTEFQGSPPPPKNARPPVHHLSSEEGTKAREAAATSVRCRRVGAPTTAPHLTGAARPGQVVRFLVGGGGGGWCDGRYGAL